jgi:carotenoid 1,2-hydratase
MIAAGAPDFSAPIPRNGYAWWYVDAFSDDGQYGLTVIAMLGSVFSPYYARARRKDLGDPLNFCALNVALYGRGGKRWALTERGRGQLRRDPHNLSIGPSGLVWDTTGLTINVREMTVPVPTRLQGIIRLTPAAINAESFTLSESGNHQWRPIAPSARVTVDFERPARKWTGHGYFDCNSGDEPLENGFSGWHWSRASRNGGTTILYDGVRRKGGPFTLGLDFDQKAIPRRIEPPGQRQLPSTPVWRIRRQTRSDMGHRPSVIKTFEDTPFYARSMISSQINGEPCTAMHESLSLDQFRKTWVQSLLHFRMPRIAR